ncbi:MAG TPA: serine hydrolase [Kofleriaceae bacterium]|nr:serine hydrolase [Kofleriaceae bacterium]
MLRRPLIAAILSASLSAGLGVGCGGGRPAPAPPRSADLDPEGSHQAAVAAAVQPYLDAELLSGLVVGLYDAGRREIYGFGKGPGGAAPDGGSLFELGTLTRVYTGLLLADALQRRELELDTPVAEYLPPGVTVPTRDKVAITLRHLALHGSGLPPLPPSLAAKASAADPLAGYDEEALYRDLARTPVLFTPGTAIQPSIYGIGLLGFVLGKKAGAGFPRALEARVLQPLELRDTMLAVPAAAAARRMVGTDDELAPVPPWSWGALAGAGGLVSSARDQLRLIEAELDAAAGGKNLPLRHQMRLTQEPQLETGAASAAGSDTGSDTGADNVGLGWMIDGTGRYWHSGGTAGFRAFVGFDPKTKRGVVALASTSSPLVDRLARALFALFDEAPPKPWTAPTPAQLATYAGSYDFAGTRLAVVATGKRLYLEVPSEPRVRLLPVSDHEFWIEALGAVAIFQADGGKIARIVFGVGTRQVIAPRVE